MSVTAKRLLLIEKSSPELYKALLDKKSILSSDQFDKLVYVGYCVLKKRSVKID